MLENLARSPSHGSSSFPVSFHILFPAFTIGLAAGWRFSSGAGLKDRNTVYAEVYRMWVKIFAVTFGMGVVSGVVLSFSSATELVRLRGQGRQCPGRCWATKCHTLFSWRHLSRGDACSLERRKPQNAFASTVIVAVGTMISRSGFSRPTAGQTRRDSASAETACSTPLTGLAGGDINPSFPTASSTW